MRPILRSLSDYNDNCIEKFDAVVVLGMRDKGTRVVNEYEGVGVPAFVVDYGYVQRVSSAETIESGHWQVSRGGLNAIVPFDCPADRFNALGVRIFPWADREGPRVLCLQHPGDVAHPFDSQAKLDEFVASTPHDEVRKHPLDADVEPLQSMLARAGSVLTWNSNIGHDALLAGVPVVSFSDAPYRDASHPAEVDPRPAYFARVAYSQWTVAEMSAGLPQKFLIDHVLTNTGPEIAEEVDQVEQAEPSAEDAPPRRGRPRKVA